MNPNKNLIEPKPYINPNLIGIHVNLSYQVFSGIHVRFRFYQVFSGVYVRFRFYQVFIKIHVNLCYIRFLVTKNLI
jgi:hypothetical protein